MRIKFDCSTFSAVANNDGSISIIAQVETLDDSQGLLLAIAHTIGADHARHILDIELQKQPIKSATAKYHTAQELEPYLIPPHKIIETKVPAEALKLFKQGAKDKVPTGIGYHRSSGWFVLQTSGQGPYLIWTEK